MAGTWLITSRGIARKVKNSSNLSRHEIKDVAGEANWECPNCKHVIDNSDVPLDWPGFPAGVKFDPSDVELLEHLAGKIGLENSQPHILIDEFIPTLEEDEGICYTHPENLPDAKKDGSSIHFFHRISNAYGTGHRKRRKINQCGLYEERVRWHKTGKTKLVLENGVHKGWKKIMVLYKSFRRGSKPGKANWVMHQYHIGPKEGEMVGELVVSKIFYQLPENQFDKTEIDIGNDESETFTVRVGPRTPKTNTPQPPRLKKDSLFEPIERDLPLLLGQEEHCFISRPPLLPLPVSQLKGEDENPAWWASESQAVDEPHPNNLHDSLLCHEALDSFPHVEDSSLQFDCTNLDCSKNQTTAEVNSTTSAFPDLDNILIDTPPDFELNDLQFGSQESITSWLDHF